jgi:TRAP-type uncharacterized transport system substrate-binding protein
MLLTDTDMSDSVARTWTKSIIENREAIASAYSAFEVFDPSKAGQEEFTAVDLHAGSRAYLEEQGYL